MNKIKNKLQFFIFWSLIVIAVTCVSIAIYLSVTNSHLDTFIDSNFVGALFSFASVLMFSAALIYQVREYKLQVEELKKSVKAQTLSSRALDEQKNLMIEQKQILLEQKRDDLIINIINNFNQFKKQQEIIEAFQFFNANFYLHFSRSNKKINFDKFQNKDNYNQNIVLLLKDNFNDFFKTNPYKNILLDYWQFAVNVISLIDDEIKKSENANFFLPFFHNQFNTNQKYVFYLINTFEKGLDNYDKLKWKNELTRKFINTFVSKLGIPNTEFVDITQIIKELNNNLN